MNWKLVLAFLTCVAVMMSSSYTMLIPFLPIYLIKELGTDAEHVNLWSGAVFAVSFAVSAVVAPLWGRLSDRTGRKLMMLRSSTLLSLVYFLGGIVETPLQLFMMRALQGFAAGLWPACLALLSAYVPKNRIGIAMGIMQSANICGGIIGPLLGGILATGFGMRNSFFIGSCALGLITVFTIFFIKEPPRDTADSRAALKAAPRVSLLRDHNILALMCCAGLTSLVIMQLQPIMTLYIQNLEGANPENIMLVSGMVFSLGGIAGALSSPIWGRTGQKRGFYKTMTVSFIAAGIMFALQSVPDTLWFFAVMQFVGGLSFSGIFPSANSILILLTPPARRGEGFALFFAAQQVGGAVGPLLGGLVATYARLSLVFVCSGTVLFAIGMVLLLRAPQGLKVGVKSGPQPEIRDRAQQYLEKLKQQALAEMQAEQAARKAGSPQEQAKAAAKLVASADSGAAAPHPAPTNAPEQAGVTEGEAGDRSAARLKETPASATASATAATGLIGHQECAAGSGAAGKTAPGIRPDLENSPDADLTSPGAAGSTPGSAAGTAAVTAHPAHPAPVIAPAPEASGPNIPAGEAAAPEITAPARQDPAAAGEAAAARGTEKSDRIEK